MKESTFPVTPALLVCAAFPILFLLAPDGIPCVNAGCGAAANASVINLGVPQCRVCSANLGSSEEITVQSCSVSKTTGKCEITASVAVRIKGLCSVGWYKFCFGGTPVECNNALALTGPNYPYYTTLSTTHGCTANVDLEVISIALRPSRGEWGEACDCTPLGGSTFDWDIYIGSGECDLP